MTAGIHVSIERAPFNDLSQTGNPKVRAKVTMPNSFHSTIGKHSAPRSICLFLNTAELSSWFLVPCSLKSKVFRVSSPWIGAARLQVQHPGGQQWVSHRSEIEQKIAPTVFPSSSGSEVA